MRRRAVLFIALTATVACGAGRPQIMTRPASVPAGGLDCVLVTLQRLGYMITAGDRSLGFVRAERPARPSLLSSRSRTTDVLLVNYVTSGTEDDPSDDAISVRASRKGKSATEKGPTSQATSEAERLLDQCGESRTPGETGNRADA